MSNKVLSYIIEVKDRATAQLGGLSGRIRGIIGSASQAGGSLSALGGIVTKLGGWMIAAQVAMQGVSMVMRGIASAVREAVAYEKDVYRLARAMGSVAEAKKAMAGLSGSDAALDFGRAEVTGAAVKLQNAGAGSLVNTAAMDALAATAKMADVELGKVAESVKDVWAALASGNDAALKSAVRSMADMGAISPTVSAELIRLREAGASAGEVFAALYGHLENNKKKLEELGTDAEYAQKQIALLKQQVSQNIGENLGFKDISDAWNAVYTKMLQGIRWLTEKPHRILLFIPQLNIGGFAKELEHQIRKRSGKDTDANPPVSVKDAAAAALDEQAAAGLDEKNAASDRTAAALAAKAEAASERDLERSRKRFFDKTASLDHRIKDAMARGDAANQRMIDPKSSQAERNAAEAESLDIELEMLDLRKEKKRQLDQQNKEEKRLAAAVADARKKQADIENRDSEKIATARAENNRRAGKRRFDRLTDEEKGKWITSQMDLGKKALAAEKDPLKREEIRGRLIDLAEHGDRIGSARKQKSEAQAEADRRSRETLAESAQSAREELAGMGLAQSVGDIGISQRFDWMSAVQSGKSPDEEIAANTHRMKELLEQIAKSEGIN